MRIEMQSGALRLARGQTFKMLDAQGSTIECSAGTLWITEEALPKDIVIGPGGVYRLRNKGLALVHAFGDATLALA